MAITTDSRSNSCADRPPSDAVGLVRWALRQERSRILLGAVVGTLWMAALALVPVTVGGAIDGAVAGGDRTDVIRWSAAIAGVVLGGALAGAMRHVIAVGLFARTTWRIEQAVTARVHDRRGGVHDDGGSLLALSTNDARRIGGIADLMCRGTGAIVVFVGVGVLMVSTSPLLGTVVLVGVPATLVGIGPLYPVVERRAAEQRSRLSAATSTAADTITGIRTVHGLGGEAVARRWFAATSEAVERSGVAVARVTGMWFAISTAVPALFLALVLGIAGTLAVDGELTPGEVVTFTGLATFLVIPLQTIAELGITWATGLASARRIAEVLAHPHAVDDVGAVVAATGSPSLRFERVTTAALDGLDLHVADDEIVGLAGDDPTATDDLLDLIGRAVDPDGGVVRLGGHPLGELPVDLVRSTVLVEDAREPWLRSGTVTANLDLRGDDGDEVAHLDALQAAGLVELLDHEDPLAIELGDRGLRLSGGQRQRLAVARALRRDAAVLVLVEPTSALDTLTELRVARSLVTDRAGRATLLVTTSPAVLALCDRVVLLRHGRTVGDGSHDELLRTDAGYRELLGVAP